ncbi:Monocarboxylate transporter 9 [Channa argus]|uniref:Monocarboxylate transporter 9 n=1 Tax=Channa argus TaxID=215402 RepID=A0A6G1QND7_CHAAH|nr:Monocarboxylate transporter 9 [Channa argus]
MIMIKAPNIRETQTGHHSCHVLLFRGGRRPCVLVVTITCLYFDKRRGLALGIVTTGTSVGGFLYSTLQSELIELLGLDGCLLIVGALALNVVACAGPMRPLSPPGYYLKPRGTILEHQLQEESLSKEKPGTKHVIINTETKDQLVRRMSLFSCLAFAKIRIKMRQYTQ